MAKLRVIPIIYIVDKAKAQANYQEALPYRSLTKDWFFDNHSDSMGNNDLYGIDSQIHTDKIVKSKGSRVKSRKWDF